MAAWIAAVCSAFSVGLVAWQMKRHRDLRPPGGVALNISYGHGECTVRFAGSGAWVFYDVRFSTSGASIIAEGRAQSTWKPVEAAVVDVRSPVEFRVLLLTEREPGTAAVTISWVSGQDRSGRREMIRVNFDSGSYEDWRQYKVRIGRKHPGRWVARKRSLDA